MTAASRPPQLAGAKDGLALGRLEAPLEARCESRDPDYSATFPLGVRLALLDVDVAELILLSGDGGAIAADGGLLAVEEGVESSIGVRLSSKPVCEECPITVTFGAQLEGAQGQAGAGGGVTIEPTTVQLTAESWSTPQWVSLFVPSDRAAAGARSATVYANVDTVDDAFRSAGRRAVAVSIADVDNAGLEWEPKELRLEEGAARPQVVRVRLTSMPVRGAVGVDLGRAIGSESASQVTLSYPSGYPSQARFTPSDWDA